MNERLVFLLLLCVAGVLWSIIGCGDGKPVRRRLPQQGWPTKKEERDRYCRMAVMAGHGGGLPDVMLRASGTVRGSPAAQAVQVARNPNDLLRILLSVTVQCAAQRRTTCVLPFAIQIQRGRDTRYRVLQGVHDRPASGRKTLSCDVHAVQRRVQICPAFQTARLVYRHTPAGADIGAV